MIRVSHKERTFFDGTSRTAIARALAGIAVTSTFFVQPFAIAAPTESDKSVYARTPDANPSTSNAEPVEKEDHLTLPNMQVFEGSETFVNPVKARQPTTEKGDITLDFTDADIKDVVRTVFGEILQQSYVIDPRVVGRMTLKTGRPISKSAVVPAMEAALRMAGAGVNRSADIYNIVPLSDVPSRGQAALGPAESQTPGYGVEILPLEYVSAEEIQRVVAPLIPDKSIIQVDSKRNLIFIAGSEPERAAVRDTLARFDVNYLKGMSFALIQPVHASATTLAGELDKIFGEANSPVTGLVRLVPMQRINSLLVITSRRNYLKEVQRWVGRLDVAPVVPDRKLHFYRLQNARAKDIAEALGRVFGINAFTSESNQSSSSSDPQSHLDMRQQNSGTQYSSPTEHSLQPPETISSRANSNNAINAPTNTPQIVTDEANNALIIRADTADYAAIEDVIKQMDVAPSQVMVEATIVEVTLNDTLKYGVEWYFQNSKENYTQSPNGNILNHFPGLGVMYTTPDIKVALSTLGSLTNVAVLSSPKILTLDNKAATIEVGDQIPIVTQTSVSTTTSNAPIVSNVSQRDTGVILSVTPRIGNSGIVYLDISQEVSTSTTTTTSNIDSPTIQQRRLRTTVAAYDGATVALGGLIQHTENSGDSGIPYLKDIPLLGAAFSTKSSVRSRTELLVFLTPHIIRNLPAALDVTEQLKKNMEEVRDAVEELPNHRNPRRPW